jgi:hypothetical protein
MTKDMDMVLVDAEPVAGALSDIAAARPRILDRAAIVESAVSMEVAGAEQLRCHGALAARELVRGASDEVMDHLRLALEAAWLEDRSVDLRLAKFRTDGEATAALECFGKDEAVRDAWVRTKLDAFRHAIAPAPTMPKLLAAAPMLRPFGGLSSDATPATIGLGRHLVSPGGKIASSAVSQGWFRPLRLFIEPAGNVGVPCEKCGHEAEGRKLSDLRVGNIIVGCETTAFATSESLPAHLFSVRHADASPPDPAYPAAGPGITISVELENRGCEPIEVDVALFGEYVRSGSLLTTEPPEEFGGVNGWRSPSRRGIAE